jgi:hypothetical protein
MKKYTVKVWEEGCGSFTFTGVEAKNRNAACESAISTYKIFMEETEIKGLSATCTLELV